MNLPSRFLARTLIAILLAAGPTVAHGQGGTIALVNTTLTRMQWYQGNGQTIAAPTTVPIVYGVFWGSSPENLVLETILGMSSTTVAGLIAAPNPYLITTAQPGQAVYLQIKGWPASYGRDWQSAQQQFVGYGETPIQRVILGPSTGPGATIWQNSDSGTRLDQFYPIILNTPLTPPTFITLGTEASLATIDEGSHGSLDAVINVTRVSTTGSSAMDYFSNILLTTSNLTAIAGQDYTATTVMVKFGPGETTRQVRIPITGDPAPEPLEQFGVRLVATPSFVAYLPQLYTVSIREARVQSVRWEPGLAVVTFPTTAHQRYALESSRDLTNWSPVQNAGDIGGTGGLIEISDFVETCCDQRFYRTRLLP